MKSYVVLYAEDIPHYGVREFLVADDGLVSRTWQTWSDVNAALSVVTKAFLGLPAGRVRGAVWVR